MPPVVNTNLLYFVRHGETDANRQRLVCGSGWDIDLNEAGRAQAERSARAAKAEGLDISHIFSSPLLRARHTAEFFAQAFAKPVTYLDDLIEWDMGQWCRRPYDEIFPALDAKLDPPSGEKLAVFSQRIAGVLQKLHTECSTPLIIGHGAVWRQVCAHFGVPHTRLEKCTVAKICDGSVTFRKSLYTTST